jgi:hypothetical protein
VTVTSRAKLDSWEDNVRTLLLTPSHADDLCSYAGDCYTRLRAGRYSYSRRFWYVCETRTEIYSFLSALEIISSSKRQPGHDIHADGLPPRSNLKLMGSFGCTDVHIIDGMLHCDVTAWRICERTADRCRSLWWYVCLEAFLCSSIGYINDMSGIICPMEFYWCFNHWYVRIVSMISHEGR